jgi:hypothetical protein
MLIIIAHAHLLLDGKTDSKELYAHMCHPKFDVAADQA